MTSGVLTLLFISLTIVIPGMIYCIYKWRVKQAQSVGGGENKEQLYEQVDEPPRPTGDVTLKQNEAYGQIKEQLYEQVDERPIPTGDVTLKQNEAYGQIKEQLYEQVDERPRPTRDVNLKQNEAYGQIQVPNPTGL